MIDMGGEPYLIASTVICLLAQRLVRTICPECKVPYKPSDDEILAMGMSLAEGASKSFFHGKGCKNCRETGYKGRVGVFELLMNTHDIKELITRGAPMSDLFAAAKAQGMRTMMQDGLEKILRGITTPTEVIHAVYTAASVESPEARAMAEAVAAQAEESTPQESGDQSSIVG
jgi:type II secretory ATPase GspE/PulE/Tfp pilus assembly ATPase PilB-like protein